MSEQNEPAGNAPEPAADKRETFSREYVSELREENKTIRLKAKDFETRLNELEKANTEAAAKYQAEAESLKQSARVEVAIARLESLAIKEGLLDPDDLKLIDASKLNFDENGKLTNGAEVVAAFKSSKPHFFGSPNTSNTKEAPKPVQDERKAAEKMSQKEFAEWMKSKGL